LLKDFEYLEHKKIIRYEKLTEDTSNCFYEICDFIGINPEEISIDENKTWRIQEKRSVIEYMNYKSFERLNDEDFQIIEEAAGHMLKRLGYSRQEYLENTI
jgi:hypothetical protein